VVNWSDQLRRVMRTGHYARPVPSILAPRLWFGHLLMVGALAATFALGLWQLDSWQERRAAETVDLTSAEPVPLTDLMSSDDPFPGDRVGRPVEVAGTWLDAAPVFVADREREGADGYWMVALLDLGSGGLPVVLGWIADPVQAPTAPTGTASLVGWLQPPEGTGAFDEDPNDDILGQLRVADLQQRTEVDLYSAYVVAQDGLAGLPQADLDALPQSSRFTALRNLLYGLEWWIFAGFVVFIWWRWVRDETRSGDDRDAQPTDGSEQSEPVASPR
jgi:surfeit locus 1 family protein